MKVRTVVIRYVVLAVLLPLLHVLSSSEKPKHSYVSVQYEDEWFWIAEDDWDSKRTFSSILFLFTLAGNYGSEGLPTITIPTF